ncbi:MAG: hypothetical protein RMX96_00015 [Nostoc sp. ChiSLP02]|nr:hypothetical protein [Nostoc sp. DedSLP05]MDZ8100217.1 hypothetical protein [Nostoc sp. DedSLP01]MDZ8183235.1 hypothetical protein [Nostoc sp. ChiSLP02]
MSLIDGLFLTLLNALACLALPKLLSLILSGKNENAVLSPSAVTSEDSSSQIATLS